MHGSTIANNLLSSMHINTSGGTCLSKKKTTDPPHPPSFLKKKAPRASLIFFCKQEGCDTTVCAMCVEETHASHNYVKLSEVGASTTRQEIKRVVAVAATALVKTSNGIAAVNERRKEVEKSTDETHTEVQQTYKMAQATISQKIVAQMKEVQAAAQAEGGRKEDVLVNQRDKLETAKERLENSLDFARWVQEATSEVELLQIKRLLVDGLGTAVAHGVPLQPLCGPSVTLVKSARLLALMEKIPSFGTISGSDTNPEVCTAEGGALKEAILGSEVEFVVTAVDFEGKKRESGGDGVVLTVGFVAGDDDDSCVGGRGSSVDAVGAVDGGGSASDDTGCVETHVCDHKNGSYTCKYTLPEGSSEGECQLAIQILGQHIQGSPFTVQVSTGIRKQFVHTSAFDGNGVLHWIGTGCGTQGYENPHGKLKPGGVVAKMSSVSNGGPGGFVEHAQTNQLNYTKQGANSWMSVDLGEGRQLAPDYYCLRHGYSSGDYRLQNWRLEGSNDDSTWTPLNTHVNDGALPGQAFSTASWPIHAATAEDVGGEAGAKGAAAAAAAAGALYRYFRVIQTGRNAGSSTDNSLNCGGIELYGLLKQL